jgi:hypothetical protein
MNSNSKISRIITVSVAAIATLASVAPLAAFAEDASVGATTNVNVEAGLREHSLRSSVDAEASTSMGVKGEKERHDRMASSTVTADMKQKADARGGDEIDKRVKSLGDLSAHIGSKKLLPATDVARITASITAEINTLNALKAKIAADTDPATLKADVESIAKSYRVYLLVIPQDKITAASDRILAVSAQMEAFSTKLSARISAATSTDAGVTSAKADYDAKVADAKVQANAAVSLIANLTPDNGTDSVRAANTAALKSAAAKIQLAQSDLKAARKDVGIIMKGLGGKGDHATATTTVKGTNSVGN